MYSVFSVEFSLLTMQQSSLRRFVSTSSSASDDATSSGTSRRSRSESRTPRVRTGLATVVRPDPADGRPSLVSREERKRLVNLGPYQPSPGSLPYA